MAHYDSGNIQPDSGNIQPDNSIITTITIILKTKRMVVVAWLLAGNITSQGTNIIPYECRIAMRPRIRIY